MTRSFRQMFMHNQPVKTPKIGAKYPKDTFFAHRKAGHTNNMNDFSNMLCIEKSRKK